MVLLRTVRDTWEANVLAARLGSEGILTHLRGNLSGPYPLGSVSVLVEEGEAELAAELLLADEVEASFLAHSDANSGTEARTRWSRYRRPLAALAALVVAGAPLLAHFVS